MTEETSVQPYMGSIHTMTTNFKSMGKLKINDNKLLRLIDKDGMNQSEAARELGVTRQAVSRRLQQLRGKTTRVLAAKGIYQFIDKKLDSIAQLKKINDRANELLDELEDNPKLQIKVMAEIRGQLKLQLEILQTLYSMQAAEEFQNAVLETLKEVSPDVRNRVIQKLNEKRVVRSALRFS